MKEFILILTLFAGSGDKPAGVAMEKFDDLKACKSAGEKWYSKLMKRSGFAYGAGDKSFYICVEASNVKVD